MKKLSVLVALALLAVAGTGYAVTCAYDNVPGATLLIPYFMVSGAVSVDGQIGPVVTDTKISFVNVSTPGVIAHVTVWNKYSKAILDFNVPMTGKDVVFFNMSDVLNGKLNVNPNTQVTPAKDVCGINLTPPPTTYTPTIGWGQTTYIRFPNPDPTDRLRSISKYATPDAFAAFRARVLDSLDESGDIRNLQSSSGANILDVNNPGCLMGPHGPDGSLVGLTPGFSGYVTVDVLNYCTNFFPDQIETYTLDALATAGWGPIYTPNVLIGDYFFVDPTANSGNISGDQAVALEFDARLNWTAGGGAGPQTFYGRFVDLLPNGTCEWNGGAGTGCQPTTTFQFGGDGREPLGDRYGFRYLSDVPNGLRSWILVWRGDETVSPAAGNPLTWNLCDWLVGTATIDPGSQDYGLYDADHQIIYSTYDNDETLYTIPGSGGPSGGGTPVTPVNYVFLEAERIDLLANIQILPGYSSTGAFNGGWIDFQLRNVAYGGTNPSGFKYNQGWVGIQHTGPGTTLNVGYSATSLNQQFVCTQPALFTQVGNTVVPNVP